MFPIARTYYRTTTEQTTFKKLLFLLCNYLFISFLYFSIVCLGDYNLCLII